MVPPRDVIKPFTIVPWVLTLLLVFTLPLLPGCDRNPLGDDLDDAKHAMSKGEWLGAQKLLERYLRTATDMEQRWDAWNRLIEVAVKVNPDGNWMVDYYEIILMELENARTGLPAVDTNAVNEPTETTGAQPMSLSDEQKNAVTEPRNPQVPDEHEVSPALLGERIRNILTRLAQIHEGAGRYERAMEALNQLIEEPGLLAEQSVEVHRSLGRINTRMRRFDVAEEILQSCLSLPVSSGKQAECMYDLADVSASRDQIDVAAEYVQQVMDTDNVEPRLHALAGFMLADLKEQQGKLTESLALFEEIRNNYPNDQVVDFRINSLKKQVRRK